MGFVADRIKALKWTGRALRYRNYRLFFMGQGISLIGTWMQRMALQWFVYNWTHSPWLLGALDFSSQIPAFLMAPWDPHMRRALGKRMRDLLRHPAQLFRPVYVQSVGIIQAPDLQGDGRADMCDSCPDITIYDGKFINSCRMDEYRLFGGFLSVTEREQQEQRHN